MLVVLPPAPPPLLVLLTRLTSHPCKAVQARTTSRTPSRDRAGHSGQDNLARAPHLGSLASLLPVLPLEGGRGAGGGLGKWPREARQATCKQFSKSLRLFETQCCCRCLDGLFEDLTTGGIFRRLAPQKQSWCCGGRC